MARKRMIDPNIWTDEKVQQLEWGAACFYIGLISQADDGGRLEWSAPQLAARIVGLRIDVSRADIERWMDAIVDTGLIETYQIGRKLYAHHPAWLKHQYVNRPNKSLLPPPPVTESSVSPPTHITEPSVNTPLSISGLQVPLESESESESESDNRSRSRNRDSLSPIGSARSIGDLYSAFGEFESLVRALLELRRLENKTGKVADTVLIGLLEELRVKREELNDDRAFGAGLAAAVSAGAPNANYVAKAARSAANRPHAEATRFEPFRAHYGSIRESSGVVRCVAVPYGVGLVGLSSHPPDGSELVGHPELLALKAQIAAEPPPPGFAEPIYLRTKLAVAQ